MVGWHLSEQARQALRTARTLAADRGNPAPGSADLLLAAILGQWHDAHAGGPALLRACGLTAEQASQLAATLLPAVVSPEAAASAAEPRLIEGLRFVLDQAYRIAAEARASYVGTEHLVVAMLWDDSFIGAHELRRLGVSYARAAGQLAALAATERPSGSTSWRRWRSHPGGGRLAELARQQAEQHPIEGGGRISTLHHLLALLMLPGRRLAGCCGSWGSATRRSPGASPRRGRNGWRARTGARRSTRLRAGRSSWSPTRSTRCPRPVPCGQQGTEAAGGPVHVRHEPRRPGMVAGADPPRRVGS